MNRIRRKNLKEVILELEELKAILEDLTEEEKEYRDNIPENLQGSERYEKTEEACDNLEEAISYLEEAINNIENSIE